MIKKILKSFILTVKNISMFIKIVFSQCLINSNQYINILFKIYLNVIIQILVYYIKIFIKLIFVKKY